MSANVHEGPVLVRLIAPDDLAFIRAELTRHWLSTEIWSRGKPFQADQLAGFIALLDGQRAGLVTISHQDLESEVITLSAVIEHRGVGTALLAAATNLSRERGDRRIFLTTTNDNLRAQGIYQKCGWTLARLWPGMMDRYREMGKPVPLVNANGLPIRDELEFEMILSPRDSGR